MKEQETLTRRQMMTGTEKEVADAIVKLLNGMSVSSATNVLNYLELKVAELGVITL